MQNTIQQTTNAKGLLQCGCVCVRGCLSVCLQLKCINLVVKA